MARRPWSSSRSTDSSRRTAGGLHPGGRVPRPGERPRPRQGRSVRTRPAASRPRPLTWPKRVEAETKLARRERTAKKTQRDGGIPKILAGNRATGQPGNRATGPARRRPRPVRCASALENVRVVAPGTPPGEVRNQLARLLLRGPGRQPRPRVPAQDRDRHRPGDRPEGRPAPARRTGGLTPTGVRFDIRREGARRMPKAGEAGSLTWLRTTRRRGSTAPWRATPCRGRARA